MAIEFRKEAFALIPVAEFKEAVAQYIRSQTGRPITAAQIDKVELDSGASHYKITRPEASD